MQQLFALFPYSPARPTATITIAATASASAAAANTAPSDTNTANANAANTAANTATSKATATYYSRPQKIIAMSYHQHSDTYHCFLKAVYHA
ncbi:hypothetical protein MXE38_11660 [Anaerobiospirillum sp. NML120448]|uniref:hypothetical protein n=1 Tax=Anaerobiospirillum sp. NML120448 TaxID=2932816 RepID=UPI001FF6D4DA|nr:hypothetical protein [Anaerobiospirillum sp. NML120448]MCK0515486.1 hypothetical protein [Anaerobiospirillum sp. NML120448]